MDSRAAGLLNAIMGAGQPIPIHRLLALHMGLSVVIDCIILSLADWSSAGSSGTTVADSATGSRIGSRSLESVAVIGGVLPIQRRGPSPRSDSCWGGDAVCKAAGTHDTDVVSYPREILSCSCVRPVSGVVGASAAAHVVEATCPRHSCRPNSISRRRAPA